MGSLLIDYNNFIVVGFVKLWLKYIFILFAFLLSLQMDQRLKDVSGILDGLNMPLN